MSLLVQPISMAQQANWDTLVTKILCLITRNFWTGCSVKKSAEHEKDF